MVTVDDRLRRWIPFSIEKFLKGENTENISTEIAKEDIINPDDIPF